MMLRHFFDSLLTFKIILIKYFVFGKDAYIGSLCLFIYIYDSTVYLRVERQEYFEYSKYRQSLGGKNYVIRRRDFREGCSCKPE